MVLKIGFPDRWKTYEGLTIARDDYAGNWLRANAWEFQQRLADLNRPVDRARWFASPHLVNAFAGGLNEIVFPAAILQPPFFNAQADDAVNYGGIGAVIGHEITHHFDDRGRQYDEVGNLAEWWNAEDAARYKERAAKVAQQYSDYSPLPGHTINGQQTLGENISDLGGVKLAYDALQRALARQPTGKIDNYTPEQRFFLSFATIWRTKYRTEALIDQLRTDSHSPARYRVLGPLANVPAFAQAFNCPAGAPMMRAPANRFRFGSGIGRSILQRHPAARDAVDRPDAEHEEADDPDRKADQHDRQRKSEHRDDRRTSAAPTRTCGSATRSANRDRSRAPRCVSRS